MKILKYMGLAAMITVCVTAANVASDLICTRIKVKAVADTRRKLDIFRDAPIHPVPEPEPKGFFGDSDPKFDVRSHGMIDAPMPEGTSYDAKN